MNEDAKKLCDIYKDLQEKVKSFEETITKEDSCANLYNGLNGRRIKIGLWGHYSSGKTTLLERIFDDYAGSISSVPETACLTVHRLDSIKGISITFRPEFSIEEDKQEAFQKFLDENELEKYVQQTGPKHWKSNQQEEVSPNYKKILDIKRFLGNVNKYMNAIEKIYYYHNRKGNDTNVLDFLEIYDLPGFGGKDEHEEIINGIIRTETFDAIIFLIDPSQGIPKNSDITKLQELGNLIEEKNKNLLFFWAYEKPTIESVNLNEKLNEIRRSVNGKLTQKFYQTARLLNIIGDKDDREIPQNVFACEVLPFYFRIAGTLYLKRQKFWDWEKKKIPEFALTPILDQIYDEAKYEEVSKQRVEEIFEEHLELETGFLKEKTMKERLGTLYEKVVKNKDNKENIFIELPQDGQRKLKIVSLENEIEKTIRDMIRFICHNPVKPTVDKNKIGRPFWTEYKKNNDWKLVLVDLREYKINKDYKSVEQEQLSNFGIKFFNYIKKNVNTIDKYIENLPNPDPFEWTFTENTQSESPDIITTGDLAVIRKEIVPISAEKSEALETNFMREIANELTKMDEIQSKTENAVGQSEQATENLAEDLSKMGM